MNQNVINVEKNSVKISKRISFEMFLKNTDEIGKDYLYNFISDFLNINITKFFFQRWLIKQLYLLKES